MEKKVVLSDLTGQQVEEETRVRLIVQQHPDLEAPCYLDANANEVESLSAAAGDFVVVRIQSDDSAGENIVVLLKVFEELFQVGDPIDALERAPKLTQAGGQGGGQKRDPAALQAMREWGRANGWPDLSDRGRVPQEVEMAYAKAAA